MSKPNKNEKKDAKKDIPSNQLNLQQQLSINNNWKSATQYRSIGAVQSHHPQVAPVNPQLVQKSHSDHIIGSKVGTKQDVQSKTVEEAKKETDEKFAAWDGVCPLNTYNSTTLYPQEMADALLTLLQQISLDNEFDFEETNHYSFKGRTFTTNGDIEFRISVFSKGLLSQKDTKSEVEIKRMNGDCFGFGLAEQLVVDGLLAAKAISKEQGGQMGTIGGYNTFGNSDLGGFSLQPLPLTDFNMDIESDSDTTFDNEIFDADSIIKEAIDKNQYAESYNMAIQDLYDSCCNENIKELVKVKNVIKILITSVQSDCYDAFAVKTVLDSIQKLIDAGASIPDDFKSSLIKIRATWSKTVVNKVEKHEFKFPKSQVVVKRCDKLLGIKK